MPSSSAKRLFAHGGIYTVSRLLNQVVGIPLLPLYAHLLGAEGFGVISLLNTVGSFLGFLFIQGMQGSWFRLRFDEPDEAGVRSLETTIVWYLTASGLVILALLTLFGETIAGWVTPGIRYLPLGLLTTITAFTGVYASLYDRKLQVEERPIAFAIFNLARTVLQLGLVVAFVVALRRGAPGVIEATALASGVAAIVSLVLIRPGSFRRVSRSRLAGSLSYGLPLVPHSLAGLTNDVIDRILLNSMLGLSVTGIYSMGYRIAGMSQVAATSLNQAFSPVFMRTLSNVERSRRDGDAAAADAGMQHVGRLGLMTVVGVSCIVLALTAVARELLLVLATPAFADSWKVVAPVGAGIVAWSCYFPFAQSIFYNPGRVRWMIVVTGLAAITNIGANLVMIPKWGIMGAALATLASDIVMAVLAYFVGQASTRVPYRMARWFGALACVATGLAGLWWMDAHLDALWLRLTIKLAWAAAMAALMLRAAHLPIKEIRQLWPRRNLPSWS